MYVVIFGGIIECSAPKKVGNSKSFYKVVTEKHGEVVVENYRIHNTKKSAEECLRILNSGLGFKTINSDFEGEE